MTAPFAPVFLNPLPNTKYHVNSSLYTSYVPSQWRNAWRVFTPDQSANIDRYALRRKLLPSGAFEYWNAATPAWQSTEVFNVVTAIGDNQIMAPFGSFGVGSMGTPTAGTYNTYQYAVRVGAGAGQLGPYCTDQILYWSSDPTMNVLSPLSTVTTSRPLITWQYIGTGGSRQKRYRAMAFASAAPPLSGDMFLSASLAVWDSGWVTDSSAYSVPVGNDLPGSGTYSFCVAVEDDLGMVMATSAGSVTVTLNLPPAPTLTAVAKPDLGAVDVTLSSAFNLLEADTSSFVNSTGTWQDLQLAAFARVALDPVTFTGPALKVDAAGITFNAMNALFASFTADNAGYASFNAQKADQQGGNPIISTPTGLLGYAVLPSTVYSFTCAIRNSSGTGSHRAIIKWYKSDGTPTALTPTVNGTTTACNASTYTEVPNKNVTSPVDAAFVAIQIESITMPVGNSYYLQGAALAKAADVFWSPGGSSAGIRFILERKVGSGAYKYVWGSSRTNPASPLSGVLSAITIRDLAYPIGRSDVSYRAYAVSTASGSAVYSSPVLASGPSLVSEAWLRDPTLPTRNMNVMLSSWNRDVAVQSQEFIPEGASGAVVTHGSQPNVSRVQLEHWSFTQADYDALLTLLTSKRTLHLQRAIGGECYFVRVVGSVKTSQVLASPTSSEVTRSGMVHKITADLTVVADVEVASATVVG